MIENINGKDNYYAAGRAATKPLSKLIQQYQPTKHAES
jgi:hypothetical protein